MGIDSLRKQRFIKSKGFHSEWLVCICVGILHGIMIPILSHGRAKPNDLALRDPRPRSFNSGKHEDVGNPPGMILRIVPDFMVNDTASFGSARGAPSIDLDGSGNAVIVWQDIREDASGDIYAQRYSVDGLPQGINFKVNDDTAIHIQSSPSVTCDEVGNFVIVWKDERIDDDPGDIFIQRYTHEGIPIGKNMQVNDDGVGIWQGQPDIACEDDGNFIVVWRDDREEGYIVYGQRIQSDGSFMGENFRVKDEGRGDLPPDIECDGDERYAIAWSAKRYSGYAVLAKIYTTEGFPVGPNFEVHLDERGDSHPSVTIHDTCGVVVAWEDVDDNGNTDIIASWFDLSGYPVIEKRRVVDDTHNEPQVFPSTTSDGEGNVCIAWSDRRFIDRTVIMAQRYTPFGVPRGGNFIVASDFRTDQHFPAIRMFGDRLFAVWNEESESGSGEDIWGTIFEWVSPLPSSEPSCILLQNYPNPCDIQTQIAFTLSVSCFVSVHILNLSGVRVCSLVEQMLSEGDHSITWNASKFPCGIYLIRMQAGGRIQTRKIVVQR